MAFVRSKPHSVSKKYRAGFTDWNGTQKLFTGTTSKAETLAMARRFEDEHRQIRLGYRKAPKTSDELRLFTDVAAEYVQWGSAQGGHGGRPWSPVHLALRTRHMGFWQKRLNLKFLTDISLPKVEAVARELQVAKKAGKTIQTHLESLKALALWAKGRGYLETDPLERLAPFDTTAKQARRALTESEIESLLRVSPVERRLIYEVALCTGYRKGELAALAVSDVDHKHNTLPLAAEFCKGRRDSRQPIPGALAAKLVEHAKGRGATENC